MLIWRGGQKAPVEIQVVVVGGAGWFKLERYTASGSYELAGIRTDGSNIDGDAIFAFSADQLKAWAWASLSLRLSLLVGNPSKTDMEVFLKVVQPQGTLNPEDAQGNAVPMLQNGVSLGKVKDNQPGLFDFLVMFW